jgi:hypothetical protein
LWLFATLLRLILTLLPLLLPDVPDVATGIYTKLRKQWTKLKARSDEVRNQCKAVGAERPGQTLRCKITT